jgi:hypothetical protein
MTQRPKDFSEKSLEPHLTEYRALREEQKTRLTMNGSMLNFILLVVGAAIAAYVQMSMGGKQQLFTPILLGIPLLTTPITLFYYDNTLMVYRIARYFETNLYPVVESVLGYNPFQWDRFHRQTSGQLVLMAFGRNLFFFLITVGPILLFLILKLGYQTVVWCFLSVFRNPSAVWGRLSGNIESWELWLLGIDVALLVLVLAAWTHSGLYFMSWGRHKSAVEAKIPWYRFDRRISAARQRRKKAQRSH